MSLGCGLHSAIADQTYYLAGMCLSHAFPCIGSCPRFEGSCSMRFLLESVWYPLHGWSILCCAIHPMYFVQAI
jgi:hypothetical protein